MAHCVVFTGTIEDVIKKLFLTVGDLVGFLVTSAVYGGRIPVVYDVTLPTRDIPTSLYDVIHGHSIVTKVFVLDM
jgi:hypothetical protein